MSETPPTADPDDVPANDQVMLATGITRVMSAPEVIEGETSTTGKTISVEHRDSTYRLDAETIMSGESEFRGSLYFELYSPERYRQRQRGNYAPGPQAGANRISDTDDLPDPSHALPEEAE